jgi:hypothetical protein
MTMRPNFSRQTRRAGGSFSVAACALALVSCTAVTRIPYTQQEQAAAVIPGIPGARIWADDPAVATVRHSVVSRVTAKQPVVLALSGGGADPGNPRELGWCRPRKHPCRDPGLRPSCVSPTPQLKRE